MRAAQKEPGPASSATHPRREDSGNSPSDSANTTESHAQPAGDAQLAREPRSDLEDLWSYLLQVLQGISAALTPSESVSNPGAGEAAAALRPEDTAQAFSSLLDILKQLQDAAQNAADPSAGAARLLELCDQLKEAAGAALSTELPAQIQNVLQELRDHLAGMAWGRMMKTIAADEAAASPGPEADGSPADALDAVQDLPEGGLQAILRKLRTEAADAQAPQPVAAENRPASASASEDAQAHDMDRQPLVRLPSASAGHAGEGGRGLETPRPGSATADPFGALAGVRDDQEAPAEGDPQAADHRWVAKALEAADAITPEGAEPAEPFQLEAVGQRLHQLNEGGLEKAAGTLAAGKEKEAAGTGRAGIFDQIVQRAIVQVKTDQSEIKIDLKPDFLGHVRMQIVSENQQISVRILTELPVVRDMLEAGLQQLRSELQNQGLHVDRLEVAVSDDPRQPPRRHGRPDELPKTGGAGEVSGTEGPVLNGRIESIYYPRRAGSTATIDMFV
jgi:flagellar hook-length control protein FliK